MLPEPVEEEETGVERFRATTALPFVHLHEATSALHRALSQQLLDDGGPGPDWSTFRVVGPVEVFDSRGGVVFEYRGSVERRRPRPRPNIRSGIAGS